MNTYCIARYHAHSHTHTHVQIVIKCDSKLPFRISLRDRSCRSRKPTERVAPGVILVHRHGRHGFQVLARSKPDSRHSLPLSLAERPNANETFLRIICSSGATTPDQTKRQPDLMPPHHPALQPPQLDKVRLTDTINTFLIHPRMQRLTYIHIYSHWQKKSLAKLRFS